MRADERRALALRAAVVEFGRTGYEATSTASIAERVGVSQPYLLRLFKTKRLLFAGTADWTLGELSRLLGEAAHGGHGPAGEGTGGGAGGGDRDGGADRLRTCAALFARPAGSHRDLLRFELALYAAAGDPELAKVARRHFESLWSEVARTTRAGEDELEAFFGRFSLLIVRALLDREQPSWPTG